jgi:hypothetical protein
MTTDTDQPDITASQGLFEGAECRSSGRPSPCNRSLRTAARSPTKDDREEEKSNPLIRQLHEAVCDGSVSSRLTLNQLRNWMREYDIRKGNGEKYRESYPAALLSNSLIKKKKTKNTNSKWLHRRINDKGEYEYWFDD